MNHDVVALGDGQSTLVLTLNGVNQGEKAISSRPDPGAMVNVARRPVPLCCLKVPSVEKRVKGLESQRFVSPLLFDIPVIYSTLPATAESHR